MLDRDRNLRGALENTFLCYILYCEHHILSNGHAAARRAGIDDDIWKGALCPALKEVMYSKDVKEKEDSVEKLKVLCAFNEQYSKYIQKNIMCDELHFCQCHLQHVRTGTEHSSQQVETKHEKHKRGMGSATKADFPVVVKNALRLLHTEHVEYINDAADQAKGPGEEFRFFEYFFFAFCALLCIGFYFSYAFILFNTTVEILFLGMCVERFPLSPSKYSISASSTTTATLNVRDHSRPERA
jgi:hypothetical protein